MLGTDRQTDRQTDQPTDIATYRAAIVAKKSSRWVAPGLIGFKLDSIISIFTDCLTKNPISSLSINAPVCDIQM